MWRASRYAALIGWSTCLVATAVAQEADAFRKACEEKLADVQAGRRVCVVGEVLPDERLRVFASTRPGSVGKVIMVTAIPPQAGQLPLPLRGLSDLKGRWVALGGFENGDDIYSGRMF